MAQTRLINYNDFGGGLNLRADAFQIAPNESPSMMNVVMDVVGGFTSRRPWVDWSTVAEGGTWNPRRLYCHVMGNGTEATFLANGADLWIRPASGSFTKQSGVTLAGNPHSADFASWLDDCYISCGRTQAVRRWRAGALTSMTDPSVASGWNDNPLSPGTDKVPRGEFLAVHNGYMWVANTVENGVTFPNRVRFSFPNRPDSWSSFDFIDIPEGGGPITGIVPFGDALFVFFPSAIFAIYGYDLNSFERNEVSRKVGAVNRQCIVRADNTVYFASWPEGVHRLEGDGTQEISTLLRPALEGPSFATVTGEQWLSWAGQRLYWTVPYDPASIPSVATSTFVFDPSLGAWTLFQPAVGPFYDSLEANGPIAVSQTAPTTVRRGALNSATDVINGVSSSFVSWYRTRWIDAGLPTIKKRWRRPDFIAKEGDSQYAIDVFVYHNFDETDAKRTNTVTVGGLGGGLWFADPDWNGTDASLATPPVGAPIWSETPDPLEAGWGATPEGSIVERAGSLGSAMSVQLEVRGPLGKPWGLSAIVMKYILRRVR